MKELDTPSDVPIPWKFWDPVTRSTYKARSKTWFRAREIAARALGADPMSLVAMPIVGNSFVK